MIWILLVGVGIFLFYYTVVKPYFRFWEDRGVKQIKPNILGPILMKNSIPEYISLMYNMFPGSRYTGFYQFFVPALAIRDPELIKQITVKDFEHFTDHRSLIDPELDPLWAKNLFSLKGQPWKDMRATLSGSFTSSKMKNMFGLMKDASDNLVQYFLKKDQEIIEVEMKDVFTRYTNDVIATAAFGVKVDSMEYQDNEFYKMGKEATNFGGFFKMFKFLGFMLIPRIYKIFKISFFTKDVRVFFTNLIKDTIRTREKLGIVRPDMINILMEARKGNVKHEENAVMDSGFAVVQESSEHGKTAKIAKHITDEDIVSQALIFFFAGFDSVSSLMCFLAYELGVNQEIQETLRREIQKTSAECHENITYEALLKMKYMDMVISETLRKWPAAVATDRVCTKPYTIEPVNPDEKPLHLKKGQSIFVPIFGIQRDPQYYPDPEKFDPDRFSDEKKGNINPYTYLPFGTGPRNCIGSRFALLETKVVIFYLLSKFEIVPIPKTKIPLRIDRKSFNMTAEGGFWFGLKRISVK